MSTQQQDTEMSGLAQSLAINTERMAQLQALFPEAFTEGKVDMQRLAAALGEGVASGRENYELSWAGKAEARAEIQERTTATLRPDTDNSVHWDATQNLYIEGENLEVLRTLQKAYFGKVKMIYIDPPYNTGNDSFVYPDDYSETIKEYQFRTGLTDEAGFVNRQTLWKKNSRESGQFHSVWLSMMYPRLFLARNLLRDDGVIFVSIDDNEAANLKLLMDEIFGEENFIGTIGWESKTKSQNTKDAFNKLQPKIETIFLYTKGRMRRFNLKIIGQKNYPLKDSKGEYRLHKLEPMSTDGMRGRETMVFPILGISPPVGKQWKIGLENINAFVEREDIFIEDSTPIIKMRPQDERSEITEPFWGFAPKEIGTAESAKKELNAIFEEVRHGFETVKPTDLIRKIVFHATVQDSLIFDFFSGSGTTAQAVLELNEEDGGNRQFICVQMPEMLEENSEAYKAGYRTIADIGRARIKKVIERMEAKRKENSRQGKLDDSEDTAPQALGFNAFKLAPSNFKEWRTDIDQADDLFEQLEYHIDSTKPDSKAGSMVYELLLKLALPITTPIQCHDVGHAKVYMAKPDSGKNVALFFEPLSDDILAFTLKAKPVKLLCLNKCFVDSQALTNFSLQLQDADIALEIL